MANVTENLSTEHFAPEVCLPRSEDLVQSAVDATRQQSSQMIGLCASEEHFVQPSSSSLFPPRGSYLHAPGMIDPDIFQIFQSNESMFVSPQVSGLFRVELQSFVHSIGAKSKILLWFLKLKGNEKFGHTNMDFFHTAEVNFVRYVELSPGDQIFAVVRNVSDHNHRVRFALGSTPVDGIGLYGGFFVTRMA